MTARALSDRQKAAVRAFSEHARRQGKDTAYMLVPAGEVGRVTLTVGTALALETRGLLGAHPDRNGTFRLTPAGVALAATLAA